MESSLTWLSSQVVLFDSKQQAFEHSFSHRVEEEFSEALSALHLRIDNLCRQRADLGAQFGHLSRRVDLIAGFAETTDSEFLFAHVGLAMAYDDSLASRCPVGLATAETD